jgi:hypothetical protein
MVAHNFIVTILLTPIIFLLFLFGYMFNEFRFQVLQVKKCNASEELQHHMYSVHILEVGYFGSLYEFDTGLCC